MFSITLVVDVIVVVVIAPAVVVVVGGGCGFVVIGGSVTGSWPCTVNVTGSCPGEIHLHPNSHFP